MEAVAFLLCFVVVVIGFGLLQIFARDLLWEITEWRNQAAGRVSERTETWDSWQVISGVISILIGLGMGCWGLTMSAQANARTVQVTAVYETVEANQANMAATLDSQFATIIPTLQAQANTRSQRVRAVDLGLGLHRATELEYGICEYRETFYLYILNYQNEQYAYLPSGDPSACRPPDWNFGQAIQLGASMLEGNWYDLDFAWSFGLPPTSTPARAATRTPTPTD